MINATTMSQHPPIDATNLQSPTPIAPRVPPSSTTTRPAHSDTIAPPVQQRLTRSMTAAARQRPTVCIIDTDSTQTTSRATTPEADIDQLDWTDDPSNNSISWNKADPPRTQRSTICIPDSDNTPWNIHTGEDINVNDWLDDAGHTTISWHTTRSRGSPIDDDTFDNFTAANNDDHATPPPPPPPTTTVPVVLHPHPSSPHQLDISTFATQNTHGLCRLP